MKKIVLISVSIVLLLCLVISGIFGYHWYQSNHVFVGENTYPINSQKIDLREEKISFDEKNIYSKKPFRKTISISFDEILEFSEKQIPAVILGVYKTNALIIKSVNKSICIYLDKKKTKEKILQLIKR